MRLKFCRTEEIEEGKCVSIKHGDLRIALCKINNKIYAFEDRCSHEEALLSEGWLEENSCPCVICPKHGSEFDLETGKALSLPAIFPIKIFKVEINNGFVEVIINE